MIRTYQKIEEFWNWKQKTRETEMEALATPQQLENGCSANAPPSARCIRLYQDRTKTRNMTSDLVESYL